MISKVDVVESELKRMFFYKQEVVKLTNEIDKITHQMVGLKSPNLTDSHGSPEDRQHKLIRLGEKLIPLEKAKVEKEILYKSIWNQLRLYEMHNDDLLFLELVYKDKVKGDEIAENFGYTDRMYVSRKKRNILERLSIFI